MSSVAACWHQTHADAVRKQVTQQLSSSADRRASISSQDADPELEQDETAQVPPISGCPAACARIAAITPSMISLPIHRTASGTREAQRAERQDRDGVAAVGLVHELEERRHVPEGLQPLRPGRGVAVGPESGSWGVGRYRAG